MLGLTLLALVGIGSGASFASLAQALVGSLLLAGRRDMIWRVSE